MRLSTTVHLALVTSALSVSARGFQARQNGASSANGLTTTVTTTLGASATQTSSTAQLNSEGTYLQQVCFPLNSSQALDMNAPCNQAGVIQDRCGVQYNQSNRTLSPSAQQNCLCNSTYWDSFKGCMDCARLHGASAGSYIPATAISAASSSYCGRSMTQDLSAFMDNFLSSTSIDYGTATTGVDVIGNKTDVSLYYTASSASRWTGIATTTSTGASTTGSSQASAGSTSGSVTAVATTTGSTTSSSSSPASTGSASGTAAPAKTTGSEGAGVRTSGVLMLVLACLAYLL